jgi:hypothetical protein
MTFNINGGNERPDRVACSDPRRAPRHRRPPGTQPLDCCRTRARSGGRVPLPVPRSAVGRHRHGGDQSVSVAAAPPHNCLATTGSARRRRSRSTLRGKTITLLNIHAIPPVGSRDRMTCAIGEREHQAEAINAFVQAQRTPVVVAGDMNATPFHRAYHILQHGALSDVWQGMRQRRWLHLARQSHSRGGSCSTLVRPYRLPLHRRRDRLPGCLGRTVGRRFGPPRRGGDAGCRVV